MHFYSINSMKVNYGEGTSSGQQVVTAVGGSDSYDSIWTIKESDARYINGKMCRTGEPIRCGYEVRFEHNVSGRNLHSHSGFKSPLSKRQEVSGYGDDGFGDGGDDWIIECNTNKKFGNTKQEGEIVDGSTLFHLKHMDTGYYLMTDTTDFNNKNCPRCPIISHFEMSAVRAKTLDSLWSVHSGFFFPLREIKPEDEPSRYQFINE